MEFSLLDAWVKLADEGSVGIAFLSFDFGRGKISLLGISNFHFDILWIKVWEL